MVDVVANEENQDEVTFAEFCEEWLREFTEDDLSPFEKGQQFAFKLVTQWLGVTDDDEDLVLCDGTGDGGIDIAYLRRADIDDSEQDSSSEEGDTWYLIQSKYGTAFQGPETVIGEGRKVIATLAGENTHLSEDVNQLMGRLTTFMQQASQRDRIILVFATERPMNEADRHALRDVYSLGRDHLSTTVFDVEDISLQTIWEARDTTQQPAISLSMGGSFVDPSSGLRVGTIPLTALYEFLAAYREKTGNLDQLYEKNVRQFLGSRRKINKGIADTLKNTPELFGLYNNGITIVVSDYSMKSDGSCVLFDPYVVNGCQTTRTVWEELRQKLDAGGTGQSETVDKWRERAARGVVVTKIVKGDNAQITDITRFTNSQNAVREQDFIALRSDFRAWASAMADRYGVFLEIQRGGWDSRKAYQKSHPTSRQFVEFANSFDLIKVYGAGWMHEPGTAFGKNAPFTPSGSIFKQITSGDEPLNVDDLYGAYRLQGLADQFGFGRGAKDTSRRQTRFMFYFIALEFLRETLIRANNRAPSNKEQTNALLHLLREENQDPLQGLLDSAIEVIDEYLNQESDDSLFKEPRFQGDLNTFLKSEQLGKNLGSTPFFNSLLTEHKRLFGRRSGGQPSPRELVTQAIAVHASDLED